MDIAAEVALRAVLSLLMCLLVGVLPVGGSLRQRCEEYTFVSLDAVGMSERPCWLVCPPVKTQPQYKKFCQSNCPGMFMNADELGLRC